MLAAGAQEFMGNGDTPSCGFGADMNAGDGIGTSTDATTLDITFGNLLSPNLDGDFLKIFQFPTDASCQELPSVTGISSEEGLREQFPTA